MSSPDQQASPRRLIAWLGILVSAIILFSATGTYGGLGSIPGRIATQTMVYAILGSWLILALARPAWRPTTPLLVPILLASGAYVLAGLASQRLRLSLESTLGGLAIALTYVFLSTLLADHWFRKRVGAMIVVSVATVATAYLIAVGIEWIAFYRLVEVVTAPPLRPSWADLTFGSPNLVATFLLVLGPLAVAIAASTMARTWPAVLIAATAAIAVYLTGSRGGYLGAGMAVLVGAPLLVATMDRRARAGLLAALRRRPLLPASLGLMVVGAIGLVPAVVYRFGQGGDGLRLNLWRSAVTIFIEHPLLGGGPGTWVQLKTEANPPGTANLILPHAHNLYLQAAAELGLVGLIALTILAVAVVRRLWAGRRGLRDVHAIAVFAGLGAFLGQSTVDNLVNLPFVCVMVVLIVAWADGGLAVADRERAVAAPVGPGISAGPTHPRSRGAARSRGLDGLRSTWRTGLTPTVLVVLVLAAPTVVQIDRAAVAAFAADSAVAKGDPARALEGYEEALSLDPAFTLYQIQRASALARVGRTGEAREQLAVAVRSDPVAVNLISLAALDLAMGDRVAALDHARAAALRGLYEPTVALNAGLIGETVGDLEFTLDQFANAVVWTPELAGARFFEDQARLVKKSAVIAAARKRIDPETGALILAYAGDSVTARIELETMSAPWVHRDTFLAVVVWLGGDLNAAKSRLETITRLSPLDWYAAAWLSRILRASGDLEEARRYAQRVTIIEADVAPSVLAEASVIPAAARDFTAGLPGAYPWAIYLRPISPNVLAPQLTLIGSQ